MGIISRNVSKYTTTGSVLKTNVVNYKRVATIILTLVLTIFAGLALFTSTSVNRSQADGLADVPCGISGDLGWNTTYNSPINMLWGKADEATNGGKKFTMQEAYGNVISWSTFNGTRNPSEMDKIMGRGAGSVDASQRAHLLIGCPMRAIITFFDNILLGISNLISDVAAIFVSAAVDPEFICQDRQNSSGAMCVNLLAILAGSGDSGNKSGIIGNLYSGIYLNLSILAFMGVAIYMIYIGLFKRQFTKALGGLATAVLIFGGGILLMENPIMIAQAPMRVATTVGGCIVMGVNGISCMDSNAGNPNQAPISNSECYADDNMVKNDISRGLALMAKMSACKVWKAFVFEPWVAGQYGVGYHELDTGGSGTKAGPLFTKNSSLNYWQNISTNLYSDDGSLAGMCNSSSTSYSYSNIALYQLDLMTSLHGCGNGKYRSNATITTNQRVWADWSYVMDAMSASFSSKPTGGHGPGALGNLDYIYYSWIGTYGHNRLMIAVVAIVAACCGGIVLTVTACYAILYLFISILLMAFAPLFFLFGIVPGQGKKIFLGWVEQVVGNILKYVASVLWLMVALELYSSILDSINMGMGAMLVFTIIITMALFMYRGEFIKMLGVANFGGTQFSNRLGDKLNLKKNGLGRNLGAMAAGFGAGFIAGDGQHETLDKSNLWKAGEVHDGKVVSRFAAMKHNASEKNKVRAANLGHRLTGAKDTSKFSLGQQLKRGNGILAQAARSYDRIEDSRRRQVAGQLGEVDKNLTKAQLNSQTELMDNLTKAGVDVNEAKNMVNMSAEERAAAMDSKILESKNNELKTAQNVKNSEQNVKDINEADSKHQNIKSQIETSKHLTRAAKTGTVMSLTKAEKQKVQEYYERTHSKGTFDNASKDSLSMTMQQMAAETRSNVVNTVKSDRTLNNTYKNVGVDVNNDSITEAQMFENISNSYDKADTSIIEQSVQADQQLEKDSAAAEQAKVNTAMLTETNNTTVQSLNNIERMKDVNDANIAKINSNSLGYNVKARTLTSVNDTVEASKKVLDYSQASQTERKNNHNIVNVTDYNPQLIRNTNRGVINRTAHNVGQAINNTKKRFFKKS